MRLKLQRNYFFFSIKKRREREERGNGSFYEAQVREYNVQNNITGETLEPVSPRYLAYIFQCQIIMKKTGKCIENANRKHPWNNLKTRQCFTIRGLGLGLGSSLRQLENLENTTYTLKASASTGGMDCKGLDMQLNAIVHFREIKCPSGGWHNLWWAGSHFSCNADPNRALSGGRHDRSFIEV